MITSQEAYYKFLLKINKGNSQFNTPCDRITFCSLYNEAQRTWLNKNVPENDSNNIANVQSIIVTKTINPQVSTNEYTLFNLPDDWFASSDGYILADKGECKKQVINLHQIKSANKRMYLFDDNNKPSFEFEWSFFTVEEDKVKVFKDDFLIRSLFFTYYREPSNISIQGDINFDGSPTVDKNPELGDVFVEQIINEAAAEFMRNYINSNGLQIAKERIDSQK